MTFTGILLVRLALNLRSVLRCKATAEQKQSGVAERWLAQLDSRRRRVTLAFSEQINSPTAVGFLRPMILMPAGLSHNLTTAEFEAVGLHEAAHLARYDDMALLAQKIVQALFPWNPAIHGISRCLDVEREVACDDLAVQATGQPVAYARCLANLAGPADTATGTLNNAMIGTSHLNKRIDWLLSRARGARFRVVYAHAFIAVASLGALLFGASRSPGLIAFAAEQRTVRLLVAVTDPLNRFVTGLGEEHFRILENSQAREILQLLNTDEPISAVIALEVRSFDHRAKALEAAAVLKRQVEYANDEVAVVEGLSNASRLLATTAPRRKIVWLITDTPSKPTIAMPPDVEIFTLNATDPDMVAFAHKTAVQVRNQYLLVYNSTSWQGQAPSVDVQVNAPRELPTLRTHVAPMLR